MSEKLIGYLLLGIGVFVILFSGISVFAVFTKSIKPVQLFSFEGVSIDTANIIGNALPLPRQTAAPAKTELLPSNVLNDTSNVFAHVILMGFVASLGGRIASLGVQLLRPIEVKLKEKSA